MLKIDHLCKKYINSDVYAVKDLCMEVKKGEMFGFLGLNGAGKSTTIKCITGIYPFDSGTILIDGHDINKDSLNAKLSMGYVPDNHSVYEKLTGREYVNHVADLYYVEKEERQKRIEEFAEKFRLSFALDRQIKGYSHGMKQKICIIAALIHKPKLWILDEPLMGLDPQSINDIIMEMKEHCKQGNTVFFSSHNIDMVAKLCDRVAIIRKGQLCEIIDLHVEENKATLEEKFLAYTAEPVQAVSALKGRKARKAQKQAEKKAKEQAKPVAEESAVVEKEAIGGTVETKKDIRVISRRNANKVPNPPRFHMFKGGKR
ncbi:MAG: ABC transporter ATP-binding protein [Clostridia bacterium]|nr:ABC transporter ATP-binding protein [Clostridia bacterium]